MLGTSLAALLFALLPFVLYHLELRGEQLWLLASLLLGLYMAVWAVFDLRSFRSVQISSAPGDRPSSTLAAGTVLIGAGAIVVQFLDALGIGFHREFGAYLLGLATLLVRPR